MAFRTGTPIDPRLAAIDFQPLVKASAIQEQANVELANAVSQASIDYLDRQKKKQEDAVNVKAIEEILDVSEGEAKAILKNPAVQALYGEKVKADAAAQKLSQGSFLATLTELESQFPKAEYDYKLAPAGKTESGEQIFQVANLSPRGVPPQTTIQTGLQATDVMIQNQMKADTQRRGQVMGIVNSLPEVQLMEELLKNDEVITGPLAEAEVYIKSLSNKFGSRFGFENFKDVQTTQAYKAIAGRNIATVIAQFGAGVGISNKDIEFARQIVAGQISLEKQALQRLVRIMKNKGIREAQRYNEDVFNTYKSLEGDMQDFAYNSLLIPKSRFEGVSESVENGDENNSLKNIPVPEKYKIYF